MLETVSKCISSLLESNQVGFFKRVFDHLITLLEGMMDYTMRIIPTSAVKIGSINEYSEFYHFIDKPSNDRIAFIFEK